MGVRAKCRALWVEGSPMAWIDVVAEPTTRWTPEERESMRAEAIGASRSAAMTARQV